MSSGGGGGGGVVQLSDGVDTGILATVKDYTNSNPLAVINVDTNGDPTGGAAVSIADGADVVEGSLADAAVITDASGTVNAKLRGLIKLLNALDYDTGAGTVAQGLVGIALPASGGPVAGGTVTNPIVVSAPAVVTALGSPFQAGGSIGNTAFTANAGTNLNTSALATQATLASILTALSSVAVTGPLTDTELRATPVPVSGTVTTGGLTDTQLRATAVPVSATNLDIRDLVFATDKVDASGTVLGAGTNEIGKLAAGSAIIGNVRIDQTTPGTTNKVTADLTQVAGGTAINSGVTGALASGGDIAHDGSDASSNPLKIGAKAIAHGANPTAVAAGDRTNIYANRAGIPWIIGGHPNIVTLEVEYTAAQTNAAIITVSSGTIIVVTQIQATLDEATTVGVGLRVGFATATTPTTTGVVLTHPGMVPGSGISRGDGSGILGIGADGEDLRITSEVPTTGALRILVSYYTIES
jgi:hypothetical protein